MLAIRLETRKEELEVVKVEDEEESTAKGVHRAGTPRPANLSPRILLSPWKRARKLDRLLVGDCSATCSIGEYYEHYLSFLLYLLFIVLI